MNGVADPAIRGIDAVGTAGGLGAVAGLASLVWPFFDGMTAALVALALVGWLARPRARTWRTAEARSLGPLTFYLVLGLVVAAWAYFLVASEAWAVGRGVVLGLAGGVVGWIGRRPPAFGEAG